MRYGAAALALLLVGCGDEVTMVDPPAGPGIDAGAHEPDDDPSSADAGFDASVDTWPSCAPLEPAGCEAFRLGCPEIGAARERLARGCDPFGESGQREGVACGKRILISYAGFSATDVLYYDLATEELVGVWAMAEETRTTTCLGEVPRDCASQHGTGWGPLPVNWCEMVDAGPSAADGG